MASSCGCFSGVFCRSGIVRCSRVAYEWRSVLEFAIPVCRSQAGCFLGFEAEFILSGVVVAKGG